MPAHPQPPKLARRFLYWHCAPELLEEIEGDLNEEFEAVFQEKGARSARIFYCLEVLRFMRMYKPRKRIRTLSNLDMLYNYFKIAFRNLAKHKAYSAINIAGLVIGITCSFLIFLYVRAELSFDQFHTQAANIHRMQHIYSFIGAPEGPAYKERFPEVRDYVRVHPWQEDTRVQLPNQDEFYDDMYIVDANFLDVFSFEIVQGDRENPLDAPDKMVITESLAKRYFPGQDAVGQSLKVRGVTATDWNMVVSAVIKDVPYNSHLQFDFLVPMQLLKNDPAITIMDSWINDWLATYLVLEEGADVRKLEKANDAIWQEMTNTEITDRIRLMPLDKIHLHSAYLEVDFASQGDIGQVRIFGAVAVIILLIACINFMNLATARASKRSKEVGVRKVMGAFKKQLIVQFLSEALLITFISATIATGLVWLLIPSLENMSGLSFAGFLDEPAKLLIPFITTIFITSLLAGAYPAFVLSAFQPAAILKGKSGNSGRSVLLRKGLVVFQFAVSIVLVLGAIVAYNQMQYVRNKSLGFKPERVISMYYGNPGLLRQKWNMIKGELEAMPAVNDVFASRMIPGDNAYSWGYKFEGFTEDPHGEGWAGYYLGNGAIEGFGMELIAGRGFSETVNTDSTAWILNESAWKQAIERYGDLWKDPIGKKIEYYTTNSGDWRMVKTGTVIGIVKDFHHHSLQDPIEPLVIHNASSNKILVRVNEGEVQNTLAVLAEKWESFGSISPFNYKLIDQEFNQHYQKEDQFSQLILIFCGLAIFVACLGLLGLASFTAELRIKEIGVRKVLGASVSSVLWLLSSSFLKLIGLAVLIAAPLGYLLMGSWLQNFEYHISVSWYYYIYAILLTGVIALLTVGYHSLKAATDNPTRSLRYE